MFICFNAIFACAEIAVIKMNYNKLAKLAAAGEITTHRADVSLLWLGETDE